MSSFSFSFISLNMALIRATKLNVLARVDVSASLLLADHAVKGKKPAKTFTTGARECVKPVNKRTNHKIDSNIATFGQICIRMNLK